MANAIPFLNRQVQTQLRAPQKFNLIGALVTELMDNNNRVASGCIVERLHLNELELDGEGTITRKVVAMEWGPGNGHSIQAYLDSKAVSKIHGVEISPRFRQLLTAKFESVIKDDLLAIHSEDARNLAFLEDSSIDVFTALNVVYFLKPLTEYFQELRRVCKPNAKIVLGVSEFVKGFDRDIFINVDWDVVMDELRKAGFEDVVLDREDHPMCFISARAGPKSQ